MKRRGNRPWKTAILGQDEGGGTRFFVVFMPFGPRSDLQWSSTNQ